MMDPLAAAHRRLAGKLLLGTVAAFAFGFALTPLYDALCAVTGLNGKPPRQVGGFGVNGLGGTAGERAAPSPIDHTRVVTIDFTGTVMPGLAWEMRPLTARLDVHPGELQQVRYLVRNLSDTAIVGQAVPSVAPGQAARHFDKIDCFCFAQQALAPGEQKELPLVFRLRPEIDRDVRNVTLAYAFFRTDAKAGE
jgi:cytochrome c oxidase assembly protein subunit 11